MACARGGAGATGTPTRCTASPPTSDPATSPLLGAEILRELAADPVGAEKLLRVLNHDLRPSQLFTPRRVVKAVGRTMRDRPSEVPAVGRELASEARKQVAHAIASVRSRSISSR